MGDHQQGDAQLLVEPLQEIENLVGRVGIEVAGRFVGDDEFGMRHDGAGDADALFLSARELAGIVIGAIRQIHCRQGDADASTAFVPRHRQEQQRQLDVFVGRQHGDQVVGLKDVPDVGGPPVGPAGCATGG